MSPSDRRQRGMALLTVLMVAILIAIVGSTTFWLLKANLRQTGKQRKDFQALHAAEAGIKYFQQHLNAFPLCHAWFTRADSIRITQLLRDTTIHLPSPYGGLRGFRIRSAQVIPNRHPLMVRFESVGGAILPDGTLDLSNGRPIICETRMRTMADFIRFSESGDLAYGDGAVLRGMVYAGMDLLAGGKVEFQKLATYVRDLVLTGDEVTFQEGHEKASSNPYTLDHIHISQAEPRVDCGGSPPFTYEEAAKGTLPDEGRGFHYSGPSKALLLTLDSVRLDGSSVHIRLHEFDSTEADWEGALLASASVPAEEFNGVLHLDGDVFLKGTLSNRSLTIASTDDILAVDDIRCSGTVSGKNARVSLGLIAQDKFFIWGQSPTHITVEAAIIAEDDSAASWGVYDDPMSVSWMAMGWSDSLASSHRGVDAGRSPADIRNPLSWKLTIAGCLITRRGGSAGPWAGLGRKRDYQFDADNVFSPPPKFPILRSLNPGTPLWEVTGWREK